MLRAMRDTVRLAGIARCGASPPLWVLVSVPDRDLRALLAALLAAAAVMMRARLDVAVAEAFEPY